MDINQVPAKIWTDVVSGKINCDYEFLAVKILLARLQLIIQRDSSPVTLQKGADELKDLFVRTQNVPTSQRDLEKILSKGGI